MPELPEVETIKRGLAPHLQNAIIQNSTVRQPQLRWPIPPNLNALLAKKTIFNVTRRGKYLLLHLTGGTLIIHLGMSGSLRILDANTPHTRHDHVDIILTNHTLLRYHDPRRFGVILFTCDNPLEHPLLQSIGIEPLHADFTGEYLKQKT
jgi:formamidopyrimidine-DNA glycosylase